LVTNPLVTRTKFLTINQNINSVSLDYFFGSASFLLLYFLLKEIAFDLLNPNPLEFLRYLFPFSSYTQIHIQFFNSAHNRAKFRFAKKCLFDIKMYKIGIRQASFVLFFPLRAVDGIVQSLVNRSLE
jgi:hypothetical protein